LDKSTEQAAAQRWLRGDLHSHCENHDLIEAHIEGAADRLDFIALSNHAQKTIFFEQHLMVDQARRLAPSLLVFFAMEWNTPLGVHANLVFPPGPNEAHNAYAFARAHDRLGGQGDSTPEEALASLAELPAAERPVLFFNHPAAGQWSSETIARYLRADSAGIIVGIEALHGHQLHAKIAQLDPYAYPGSAVGQLCDGVYAQRRPFALLTNSDSHVHKMSYQPDYALGVFNHVRAGVSPSATSAEDLFAALRAGRTCAAQGHWLDLADFSVDGTPIGATWQGGSGQLRIAFDAHEDLAQIELIGSLQDGDKPAILHAFGPQQVGRIERSFSIEKNAYGFVRLRVTAKSRQRPARGPDGPKLFQTSAIFLGT
jgi:hypothetical protein